MPARRRHASLRIKSPTCTTFAAVQSDRGRPLSSRIFKDRYALGLPVGYIRPVCTGRTVYRAPIYEPYLRVVRIGLIKSPQFAKAVANKADHC